MFRHVVMFTWADSVDDAHVAATADALSALPGKVDTIRNFVHGPDAGLAETNADYVVVADFDDVAGYETYRDNADHRAMIAAHIAGHVSQRMAVQYEIDD